MLAWLEGNLPPNPAQCIRTPRTLPMCCAIVPPGMRGGAASADRLLLRGLRGHEGRCGRLAGGRRKAVPRVQDDDQEDVRLQPHRLHRGQVCV